MSIDWRGEALNQIADYCWWVGHSSEHIFIIIIVNYLSDILIENFECFLLNLTIRNHVQISVVDRSDSFLVLLYFRLSHSVNTNNLNSVSWSETINVVVICYQGNRWRSLAFRDKLRQLLKLDELFIRKGTRIVDNLECFPHFAFVTNFRLINLGILQTHINLQVAVTATK